MKMPKTMTKNHSYNVFIKQENKIICGTIISLIIIIIGIFVLYLQIAPIVKKEKETNDEITKATESVISNSVNFYSDISKAPEYLSNMVVSYNNKDWSNTVNYSTSYKLVMKEIGEEEYIHKIQLYSSYASYELWRNNKSDLTSLSNAYNEITNYIENYNSNSYKAYFTKGLITLGFSEVTNSLEKISNAIDILYKANDLYRKDFISNNNSYIYHIALSYCNISDLYTNYSNKSDMSNRIFFASKTLDILKEIENHKLAKILENRALNNYTNSERILNSLNKK